MGILATLVNVRRDTEFYRPELDELPASLKAGLAEMLNDDARQFDMEYTRVLGFRSPGTKSLRALGIYSMSPVSDALWELRKWRMEPDYQGQGLGRRLLGHALGLAESKGGRRVTISVPANRQREQAILHRYGFAQPGFAQPGFAQPGFAQPDPNEPWAFDLSPE